MTLATLNQTMGPQPQGLGLQIACQVKPETLTPALPHESLADQSVCCLRGRRRGRQHGYTPLAGHYGLQQSVVGMALPRVRIADLALIKAKRHQDIHVLPGKRLSQQSHKDTQRPSLIALTCPGLTVAVSTATALCKALGKGTVLG